MSRHRNVRNLDEDDYYDDYDDDDDDYYYEQQKEKERKQKEAAAKKAKENKLKQQQLEKQKQLEKQEEAAAKKKAAGGGAKAASGGGGLSVATAKRPAKAPSGFSVEAPAKAKAKGGGTSIDGDTSGIGGTNRPSAAQQQLLQRTPQMPPSLRTYLKSTNVRSHLSMIVLGHVDAGKSTLTGRLLLQLGHIDARLVAKYQREASTIGKSSFALAWVTDEDESERERGVTMDVGTKFARTERHDLTILDAPGHRDFVPNMINGASCADCGLLVAAATTGEFEAGFAKPNAGGGGGAFGGVTGGQTREHVVLARGLGVSQLVVAVNKLDAADPPWSQERFEHVKSSLLPFLIASGFKEARVKFVPCSGLTGANVQTRKGDGDESIKALTSWYKGPTLLGALDALSPAKRDAEKPLRIVLSDVRPEGRTVAARGRIVQGWIKAGDAVAALPVGDVATVSRVERGKAADKNASPYSYAAADGNGGGGSDNGQRPADLRDCASAGDTVELSLSNIDPARLGPGCVLSHAPIALRPHVLKTFIARIVVMDRLPVPILRGSQLLLHTHGIDVPATVRRLIESQRRGETTPRLNPRVLGGGATATVEIVANERIVMEEYGECKALGRFVLRRGGDTVAVGLIEKC